MLEGCRRRKDRPNGCPGPLRSSNTMPSVPDPFYDSSFHHGSFHYGFFNYEFFHYGFFNYKENCSPR